MQYKHQRRHKNSVQANSMWTSDPIKVQGKDTMPKADAAIKRLILFYCKCVLQIKELRLKY